MDGDRDEGQDYAAYLAVAPDGGALAQSLDLPGLFGQGASMQQALDAFVAAIPAYFEWLRRHDDYTPEVHGPFSVEPRETVQVARNHNPFLSSFFTPDAAPLAEDDLDWGLTLLGWAWDDLLAAIPTGVPAERAAQLGQTQLWLLARLGLQPSSPVSPTPTEPLHDWLRAVAQAALTRLRATDDDERARVAELDGERWSLRKVVRASVALVLSVR